MTRMIFVNLPVKDLARATAFYEAIGFQKNEQFSDETSSSMVWSDTIFFQIMTHEKFASFISLPIADAHEVCPALFALSLDSRDAVDAIMTAAEASGGQTGDRDTMDFGWMYNRAFADPDGNIFEAVWMDMSGVPA
ncbi:putative lactoylglutathione lyase [Hartmannibacter diazotrophicus]|uniref:Putative lactoylglutathione lyase n=1 Tax=Hartmannibacter diazotrophicus TaxID=1482074 RepID=A0A2C9DAV6_9HYPH|nr:VOC family protein [Hartmannibacter diazotrophicus]SON56735.1 putative lactoylglutathione lyase [Hartmannibacter diazotrophicus]